MQYMDYINVKRFLCEDQIHTFKFFYRFLKEESDKNRKVNLHMGGVFDSMSEQGFATKRRRSENGKTAHESDFRLGARFRRIPALEGLDLD